MVLYYKIITNMNLTDILEYITTKLNEDQRLQSVYVDNVYECWNRTNSMNQYISTVVDFQNSNYMGEYCDYNFVLYIGNMINEKQTNIYSSISISDSIAQQLLHKIDTEEENGLTLVVPNNITPFVQKFEDVLAGVYCIFTIRISAEIIC